MENNLSNHSVVLSSDLEVIGENTVYVHENLPNISTLLMEVMLENDRNMNNINPRSYIPFSRLCELAVKAYIYNTLIVSLDKGYIHTGHDLGMVKQIITSYEGANLEYEEYLTNEWAKIAYMNDPLLMSGYVQSIFNNNI
jgi:hypothetical protein